MDWTKADISEIAAALAAAQGEFEPAVKRLTAKIVGQTKAGQRYEYKYNYADLAEILSAVMAALSKNGIAVIQPSTVSQTSPRFQGDTSVLVSVQTVLLHKSGQVIAFDPFALRADSDGPQAVGSTLTYGRRYSLQTSLGIAPEFDDDGAAGQGGQAGGAGDSRPDRRPVERQQNQPQQQRPAQNRKPPPQNQANQAAAEQKQPNSPEFDAFMADFRQWRKDYSELFPADNAVWQVVRPICDRRGLGGRNIRQVKNKAVFDELREAVRQAIAAGIEAGVVTNTEQRRQEHDKQPSPTEEHSRGTI